MKRTAGFTLFEVLIAIFILVSSVFVLSDLQIKSLFRVLSDKEKIDRVFLVKKELYKLYRKFPKKKKAMVVKLEDPDPDIKITTQEVEIGRKSILKDMKDQIAVFQTEGQWRSGQFDNEIKMLFFVPKPQEDKDKKKK